MQRLTKILIIDDSMAIAGLIRHAMQELGYEVFLANNGEMGLYKAELHKPDLILLDIIMPGDMDGYETCKKLKQTAGTADIPVIFMSSLSSSDEKVLGLNLGAVDYVTKPIQTLELLSRVNTHLTIGRLQQKLQNMNKELEDKVAQRTEELVKTNQKLQQEIDDRIQIENALRLSENKLTKILENLPIGLGINDKSGNITFANKKFNEMLGFSDEKVTTIDEFQSKISNDPKFILLLNEVWKSDIQRVISGETEKTPVREYAISENNKADRSIEIMFTVYENQTFTLVNDITSRKLAEESLQRMTERFLIAKRAANIGVWDYNLVTENIFWDDVMYELYEMQPIESSLYDAYLKQVHSEDVDQLMLLFNHSIKTRQPFEYSFRIVKPNGAIAHMKSVGKVILDSFQKPIRFLGITMDITKTKQLEAELIYSKVKAEESDRLKTVFLQNMSHEIRTPMNAIIGFADLLNYPDISEEKRRSFIEVIQQRSLDLLDIISEVLDLSNYETGPFISQKTVVSLNTFMRDIFELFEYKKARINKDSIQFKTTNFLSSDQSVIETDNVHLRQILVNIIENAFKFTEVGRVSVSVALQDEHTLLFSISDTGIGIPVSKQQYIFERFRQGDEGDHRMYGGTGLGLTIAKLLIEKFGGKIWVESSEVFGSNFYFTFPYIQKPNTISRFFEYSEPMSFTFERKKILILAESAFANSLQEHFENQKSYVFISETVSKAMSLFLTQSIDLFIVDAKVLGEFGFEIVENMMSKNPSLTVVSLTDFPSEHEKFKCFKSGCSHYLSMQIPFFKLDQILIDYFI